jgi:hypothetical protein
VANAYYKKLTAGLIAAWFLFSLSASARHVFENDSARPPLALGLAVLIPIGLFAVWWAASPGFREFALSLNPRTLTVAQSWRIAGYVFLVLQTYGILPAVFAQSAGWGDIAIGATAILVATRLASPDHRRAFIVWQVLGMLDLVNAVTVGTTVGLINPRGIPTTPLTVLPLSLIPAFAVPLFFILHIICIAQARRWPARSYSPVALASSRA